MDAVIEKDLALDEMETTLIMRGNDRGKWECFTNDKVMMRRLEKAGAMFLKGDEYGKWYDLAVNQVTLRRPMELSDEAREERRARARRNLAPARNAQS